MGDALHKKFTGLDGRDDPVLQGASGAISCRLMVGFLVFHQTADQPELTAPQVSRVSGKRQFAPGVSAEKPITLPYVDHEVEDSCIGLD
jgi:hypothetical protein